MKLLKEFPKVVNIGDKVVIDVDGIPTVWEKVKDGWLIDQWPCPEELIERQDNL